MKELSSFAGRATAVKQLMTESKGLLPTEENFAKAATDKAPIHSMEMLKQNIVVDMREGFSQLDKLRAGAKDRKSIDMDLGTFVKEKWGFAPSDTGQVDSFYSAIGVDPANHTLDSLMTMPDFDDGYRWLIPEIIREAVRTGLRRNPIYPGMIAAEENVNQPTVTLPQINMSDAMPKELGESETIPTGTVSFGQKSVGLQKVGTGIKITDEVQQFVSLNVLAIYLEDVGVKLNLALDTLMVDTLINGDGNDNAAPVIGVGTAGVWAYKDLLRAWIRMGLIGRLPQGILSNEDPALDILMLPEFRSWGNALTNQGLKAPALNLRTPVPTSQNYDIHGAMPISNQIMLVDNRSSLIKLNASALRVESSRVAERQISGTYVTLTTGFAKLFDDGALIIDNSLLYTNAGFPTWMSPIATQTQRFKK